MIIEIFFLLIGIFLLAKLSMLTIKYATNFSRVAGISQMAVGFIIIAVSTSIPELTIAVISSLKGEGVLSIGNVIGANVSNITLIFGIMALSGFMVSRKISYESRMILIITSIVAFFLLALQKIDYAFGIFSIIVFCFFSKMIIMDGKKTKKHEKHAKKPEIFMPLLCLLLSIAGVIISANIVTDSAIKLSSIIGIAESVIGATIIAISTTMPELSVALAALKKRNIELAVGDGIGSILTNITLVAGVASLINPVIIGSVLNFGLVSLLIVNVIVFFLISRGKFKLREAIILLSVYAAFVFSMLFVGAL